VPKPTSYDRRLEKRKLKRGDPHEEQSSAEDGKRDRDALGGHRNTGTGMKGRPFSRTICALYLLFAVSGLVSCGGSTSMEQMPPAPPAPPNLTPTITSISPTIAGLGGAPFLLTVNGTNFLAGDSVTWQVASGSQTPLSTTFISHTTITAAVPGYLLSNGGLASVFVSNSSGPPSNSVGFAVNFPVPSISSMAPASVQAGAAPLVLIVNGNGFLSESVVQLNGIAQATNFNGVTQLSVAMTASALSSAATLNVSVSNPTPGGGVSPTSPFTITPLSSNPVPMIASMSDESAGAGWPGFPLTITGTGFVAGTITQWNGLSRPTSVLSDTLLKSVISASDLSSAGAAQIGVFNVSPGGGISNTFNFTIKAVSPGAVGVIERSSIASDLTEANLGSEQASISGDGRFIAFSSDATTLVPNDTNGFTDIFLRDTCLGAAAGCLPSVIRLSVATDGSQSNGISSQPAISANGRYVAFVSDADNLVPGDTNQLDDVFVRDTCFGAPAGCIVSTARVSLLPDGSQSLLENEEPAISADGRFVAFASGMTDFYYGANFNVFVRDTCVGAPAGCKPSTTLISALPNGAAGSIDSEIPAISSDGRYVAFESADQMTSDDTDQVFDVFLRDTCVGAPAGCSPSTILVSLGDAGSQSAKGAYASSISGTGRFVIFDTHNSGVQAASIFVRDTCVGAPAGCSASTTLISVGTAGAAATLDSRGGFLSADGRFVAFESDADNLVSIDTNKSTDVFVRDTCVGAPAGCTPSTILLSQTLNAVQGNAGSFLPVISGDGHFVAFISNASNLAPGDTNGSSDVFLSRTGITVP
jgi:trimeric autotransporter adhesin